MKDAKLNLCRAIIEEFGADYRNRKRQLNRAEKALYESALKIAVRELAPRGESAAVLAEYEAELSDERARAEAARAARMQKAEPPVLKTASAENGGM